MIRLRTLKPPPSAPQPMGWRSILLAVLISLLWGANLVSIKISLAAVPPMWSAFWRMLLGVITLGLWARSRGAVLRPAPGEARYLFGLGALFTGQIGLLNKAMQLTSPGYGEAILNSYAIFANLFGHFLAHEDRLTGTRIAGLLLSLSGVSVLAFGRPSAALAPNPLAGNLLLLASAVLLGLRQVYTRWMVQKIDPVRAIVWQLFWSVPLFLAAALFNEPLLVGPLTAALAAAIAYQGFIVAGFCFVAWAALLKKHSSGTVSMFAFIVPVAGIALSAVLFGEAVTPRLAAGGALVLGGVAIVTGTRKV